MRALHFAAYNGHLECIKLLVNIGKVDINKSFGAKKMSAVHFAASMGHF
jgi:hypothetical protein